MAGEVNLSKLLRSLNPVLHEGEYVYCLYNGNDFNNLQDAVCTFREEEGLTVILPRKIADDKGLEYTFIASWITLTVHSSLEAVGLTAAAAKSLALAHVSCNVVSANYHDHIFVPAKDKEKAMRALRGIG